MPGPYRIGEELEFTCEATESKPEIEIIWIRADENVEETSRETIEMDGGVVTSRSSYSLVLDRDNLAVQLACRLVKYWIGII